MINNNSIKQLHPTHDGGGDIGKSAALAETLGQKKMPIHTISEQIGDKRYVYNQSGNPSGDVIVHFHGLVGSKNNFRAQMSDPQLADYNQLSVDLHTNVKDKQKLNKIDAIIDYLHDFLQAKGLQKAVLHGVSLGGEITYKFAAKYPTMVDKLILSGASGLQHENLLLGDENLFGIKKDPKKIKAKVEKQFLDPKLVPPGVIDGLTNDIIDLFSTRAGLAWILTFARHSTKAPIQENYTILQQVANNNIKSYLLWGNQDDITPFNIVKDRFTQSLQLSDDHIYTFPSGHTPNIECPKQYNEILQSILAENSQ